MAGNILGKDVLGDLNADGIPEVGSASLNDIAHVFNSVNGNIILTFEMNNPWIGSPWAAVGQAIGDSGWKNDRTDMGEGDSHVFCTTFYTDDDEYNFYTRVIRLSDTDTKNFEVYPGWLE